LNKKFKHPISDGEYKRSLKSRHVQLIAIGGIVGSGFFLSTGELVHQVGPSAFLAYILGGIIIYLTMICMGELTVSMPVSGSFINYTSEFISPAVACGVGWAYWISWVTYIPAECISAGIIMQYFTGINIYFCAILFGFLITLVNLAKVGLFGEIEFWLAIIKISALLGFSILSFFIFFGFIHGSHPSDIIGTKYLLGKDGIFPKGIAPLLSAMVLMLVNYQGSEIIGLTAGESENPSLMIPRAIRNVSLRVILIYVLPVYCLVSIYPWQKANIHNSVFADALNFYGLNWAGLAVSLVTLVAALSCSNSGVYGVIRSLYTLSRNGMAPKQLAVLSNNYVPKRAGIITLLMIWLLIGASYLFRESTIYISLLLISGFTGSLSWIALCIAQINFRKRLYKAGYTVKDLHYVTPGSPYTGIIAVILMICCLIFLGFAQDASYKLAFYIGMLCLIIPTIWFQFFMRDKKRYKNNLKKNKVVTFDDIFPVKK
jgi:AAT family amino acid transporter